MSGRQAREQRRAERLEAESEAESQDRRRRLIKLGSAAAFLAIAAVAVLIVVSQSQNSGGDTNLESESLVSSQLKGIPQQGLVLGEPSAKVTLVEFGDLQCPVCKEVAEQVIPPLIDSKVRSGEAKLEFRNFTIIDQGSATAGAAAIAAGEQNRGWNYVELFYRNQGIEGTGYVDDEFLTEIAKGAGVGNISKWDTSRLGSKATGAVEKTTAEAERIGFRGTPSFAVEGPGVDGLETLGTAGSASELEAAIDSAQ